MSHTNLFLKLNTYGFKQSTLIQGILNSVTLPVSEIEAYRCDESFSHLVVKAIKENASLMPLYRKYERNPFLSVYSESKYINKSLSTQLTSSQLCCSWVVNQSINCLYTNLTLNKMEIFHSYAVMEKSESLPLRALCSESIVKTNLLPYPCEGVVVLNRLGNEFIIESFLFQPWGLLFLTGQILMNLWISSSYMYICDVVD